MGCHTMFYFAMGSHKSYCVMGSHYYCIYGVIMGPHRSGKSQFPKIMPLPGGGIRCHG